MGLLERRLLWTTLDAERRMSLDGRRRGNGGGRGGGAPPGMADLGGGAAAGLATAAGPEEAAGTPDWVAQFRCGHALFLSRSGDERTAHIIARQCHHATALFCCGLMQ